LKKGIDRKNWNRVVIDNFGSPLHSWEWAKAKELSGENVKWFFLDNDRAYIAVPVFVRRKFGCVRLGWIPHGIPFKGELKYIRGKLMQFFMKNGLVALVTSYYDFMRVSEVGNWYPGVHYGSPTETFVLSLKDKTQEDIFKNFNSTTRKHIRRGERKGIYCEDFDTKDFTTFWDQYAMLGERKSFQLSVSYSLFVSLMKMVESSNNGLRLIAKKAIDDGVAKGYLITLEFGRRAQEFLRVDQDSFKKEGFGPKFLTYSVLLESLRRNVAVYDFGGVDKDKLLGIYQFKKGFGGEFVRSCRYKILLPI